MTEETGFPRNSGTPESTPWFWAELEAMGQTQSGFARWLTKRGDDRRPSAILRHVQRMANGEARISGEIRVILSMMRAGAKRAEKRQAKEPELA
jgi:hypothetical protein